MAKPRRDLTGQSFGRLRVVEYAGDGHWRCICDHDGSGDEPLEVVVRTDRLTSGQTRSCGCLMKERNKAAITVVAPQRATPSAASLAALAPLPPGDTAPLMKAAYARLEALRAEIAALENLIEAHEAWMATTRAGGTVGAAVLAVLVGTQVFLGG